MSDMISRSALDAAIDVGAKHYERAEALRARVAELEEALANREGMRGALLHKDALCEQIDKAEARAKQAEKELDETAAAFLAIEGTAMTLLHDTEPCNNADFLLIKSIHAEDLDAARQEMPVRAQTLLAVVKAAEEETDAEDMLVKERQQKAHIVHIHDAEAALGEATMTRRVAVQAYRNQIEEN